MWRNVSTLSAFDPDLAAALDAEAARQEAHIELIASENYASPRVMTAQGTLLTNKYAEGYPGRRYYGGCEHVDVAEELAIDRAKQLFDCEFANVQPHSGAQANAAVFLALLKPGETFLGMSLAHGGHLTHGAKPNFSGKNYNAVHYEIDPESGLIDYEKIAETARREQPKMLIGGFSAYSRRIDWGKMRAIADEVGAKFMVDMAHVAGLVAAGEYPSPIPHAHVVTTTTHKTLRGPRGGMILSNAGDPDLYKKLNSAVFPGTQGGPLMHVIAAKAVAFAEALEPEFKDYQAKVRVNAQAMGEVVLERGYNVVSGGTDNHLILVSMVGRNVTGHDAEETLGQAHITVNKNSVPNDPRPPRVTSGLRLGSPASTTRGFNEDDMRNVAHWICDVLDALDAEDSARVDQTVDTVRGKVEELCARYPVYAEPAPVAKTA
ncbi:serine hydroxymethyltransferase [Abyssibacter sp.]|uniref:serine hydroxymethyltransferase n=1 Tax=Abyssibacter sp. TaxID=2320200 RepID=UPI003516B7AE